MTIIQLRRHCVCWVCIRKWAIKDWRTKTFPRVSTLGRLLHWGSSQILNGAFVRRLTMLNVIAGLQIVTRVISILEYSKMRLAVCSNGAIRRTRNVCSKGQCEHSQNKSEKHHLKWGSYKSANVTISKDSSKADGWFGEKLYSDIRRTSDTNTIICNACGKAFEDILVAHQWHNSDPVCDRTPIDPLR